MRRLIEELILRTPGWVLKERELKPRRFWFFGWRTGGKRMASNYPWGIYFRRDTSAGELEQEMLEWWRTIIEIAVLVILLILSWKAAIVFAVLVWNPWTLAWKECFSRAWTLRVDANGVEIPGVAIEVVAVGMVRHYWFLRFIRWDAAKVKSKIERFL